MAVNPFNRKDRRNILRGVYEENLRMTDKPVPVEAQRRRFRWGTGLAVVLVGVVVAVASFAYQGPIADRQQEGIPGRLAVDDLSADSATTAAAPGERPGPALRQGAGALASNRPSHTPSGSSPPIASLLGLQVKTIVIDPGHGGRDPGAVGHLGTVEKDITLDVARRLKRRLEQRHGYRIMLTRNRDRAVSLKDRAAFANEYDADLFISLHVNWLPEEPVTSIETYYFGTQADRATLQLAERENATSDYSLADFKNMLQSLETTMRLQESKRLAMSIQRSMYRNVRQLNRNVSDWGVRTAPFVVLLGVEAPSVLSEIAVISNREEEKKLNTDEHREKLTMFLEEGIVNYLNQGPNSNEPIASTDQHGQEEE